MDGYQPLLNSLLPSSSEMVVSWFQVTRLNLCENPFLIGSTTYCAAFNIPNFNNCEKLRFGHSWKLTGQSTPADKDIIYTIYRNQGFFPLI